MALNKNLTADQVQWQWMDDGLSGWTDYSPSHNALIQDALRKGRSTVDIDGASYRQRYRIKFLKFEQENRSTHNCRPIRQTKKLTPSERLAQLRAERLSHFNASPMAPAAQSLWRRYVDDDDDGLYWDAEDEATHGPFGRFCEACAFEPDAAKRAEKDDNGSVSLLALLFYYKAGIDVIPPSAVTREEFMTALSELKATDEASITRKLCAARDSEMVQPEQFRHFYEWAFHASCRLKGSGSINYLATEYELSACDLWETLLVGNFAGGRSKFRPLEHFIGFVKMEKQPKRKADAASRCTEDDFKMVLTLAIDDTFSEEEGYDDEKYSVLCDDFVAFLAEHDLLSSSSGGGSSSSSKKKKRRGRKK